VSDAHVRPLLAKWRIGWSDRALSSGRSALESAAAPACYFMFEGTNARACPALATDPTKKSCPIRTATGTTSTQACAGGTVTDAYAVSDDGSVSGFNQDIATFCCAANYAGKTCALSAGPGPAGSTTADCPAGHFCSGCGDAGGNKCKACFQVPFDPSGSRPCALSLQTDDEGVSKVCVRSCPAAHASATNPIPTAGLPHLSLIGQSAVTVECGSTWADPGASAVDICDGDISSAITTSSTVDTSAAGSYTVSYGVTDASSLSASAHRTVIVEDTSPPTVAVKPIVLWPPDHKLHRYTLADCATATDACAGQLELNAAGVITGASEGVVISGPFSFAVAAERPGNSAGSISTVDFVVTDPAGNAAPATCTIVVPHDMR
jgi:hypothetical protein